MKNELLKLIYYFENENLLNNHFQIAINRTFISLLIINIMACIVAAILITTILGSASNAKVILTSQAFMLFMAVGYIAIMIAIKRNGIDNYLINLFNSLLAATFISAIMITGGISLSPDGFLFILLPVHGFILGSNKMGITWLLVSIFLYFGLVILEKTNIVTPFNYVEAEVFSAYKHLMWSSIICLTILPIMAYSYYFRDLISEKNEEAEKYLHLANEDLLTQLANKSAFETHITRTERNAKLSSCLFAVLYINLDNFKPINDKHGHHVGDELLINFAKCIKPCFRVTDCVARIEGNKFAIVLSQISSEDDVVAKINQIKSAIAEPVKSGNIELPLLASIGAAIFPTDGINIAEILQVADERLYQNKQFNQ